MIIKVWIAAVAVERRVGAALRFVLTLALAPARLATLVLARHRPFVLHRPRPSFDRPAAVNPTFLHCTVLSS